MALFPARSGLIAIEKMTVSHLLNARGTIRANLERAKGNLDAVQAFYDEWYSLLSEELKKRGFQLGDK